MMNMTETIATFSPLYQQIKALILGSLQTGEWKPGEAIPSENELAARFKVSQGTVRKAIDELASENLLVRRQGKGTFVATHHEDRVHFRFLKLVPDDGEPHYPKSKILDCKRLRAPAEIARLLDLKSGDPVIQIERVLFFSEKATVYEEIWLPGSTFKGLTTERLVEWRGPMYALFETEFATHMVRATERLRAVGADELSAQHLGVAVNTPLLAVERVSFTYGERPVEVRKAVYLTDQNHYLNELN
jgi:GntR family transcriptional regulator